MSNNIAYANVRATMARADNMTLGALADRVGMNRDTLARKLSRKAPLNLDDALRISHVLGENINFLFAEIFAEIDTN